jgi:hypothetical protein
LKIAVNDGFDSYQWRQDGTSLSGVKTAIFETTARNIGGIGTHTIAVKAILEGKSYAKNITIKIQ